uniref:ATP-dependent DNA helicase n=1 Tax=Anopheles dirus TaxID=7168 RepID=A0A182N6N5_9DIPT
MFSRFGRRTWKIGLGYHDDYHHPQRHRLPLWEPCPYCAAMKWPTETSSLCCNGGQIVLPSFDEPPVALQQLFQNTEFIRNIRAYNNAFAFTSMGASIRANDRVRQDESVAAHRGVYNYRIQGALCHRIGSLTPLPGHTPQFAQLYFYDSSSEEQRDASIDARVEYNRALNRAIVSTLHSIVERHNPLAAIFHHAYERMNPENNLQLRIHARMQNVDQRRYNRPTVDEIGGIFVCTENAEPRDIILQKRTTGALMSVFDHNQLYDALQYPLLHPYGEVGWTFGLRKEPRRGNVRTSRNVEETGSDNEDSFQRSSSLQVSPREYAAYRICWREGQHSLLHRGGRLMQQYCVDQFCKMEGQRLKYQRDHQSNLRADAYAGIMDLANLEHIINEIPRHATPQITSDTTRPPSTTTTLARAGTRIILAPSFVGSDRYMRAQYQDAMAIVRAMGKPDLFITVTCNPAWPEVTRILLQRQQAADRPDLTARVFRLKLKAILDDISAGALGDRYMRAQYQDAMAIVRAMGKPDLFITVTCNPAWPEVTRILLQRQQAADRPDLTARVFRLKLKAILDDISAGALGLQVAQIHVIEFQKRGLPHAHCLLILGENDKPRTEQDFDRLVSAEIPDPQNAELYETVTKCMMHGPCGRSNLQAPCMKDGTCSKHYPKAFCEQTSRANNGYPLYRRRNNGRTVTVKGVVLDNRHVVPYNPWLSHKYNCHINVEVCTTVTSVKYLYKYVYKGHDRIAVSLNESVDEIQQYLDARYISASESCWRIMRFEIQAKSHTIVQLPIHLEHQQSVLFRPQDTVAAVLNRGHNTMLTRFFELAANDNFAKTLTYQEIPMYYRYALPKQTQRLSWHNTGKNWIRRCRNSANNVIGRMVSCSMTLMERYCMRLLLCYRKGPTSFEDLRTVDGTVCVTYQQAATLAGLLQDDSEWDRTMQEASQLAELIRQTSLIVWDEASMSSRYALEAVDRTLQDIMGIQRPFGGKVMLLSGDFRQILPIVPKGSDAQIINQCLKRSPLWAQCHVMRLKVNMRVTMATNEARASELQTFAEFLLQIDVAAINNAVLDRLPEISKEYLSVDTLVNPEEHNNLQLPSEYLNSLNMSGVPLHRLMLKRFAPVLLMRNLNTQLGLCNGTRLQIVDLKRNCVHARILTGKRRGEDVLLPRIYCDSNDAGLPFQIRRKQFPLQVCFGMTINKSQGQSLNHLGLFLPTNVFAHGQLYVALSRVTSRQNVAVLILHPAQENREGVATKNIVYKEIVGI